MIPDVSQQQAFLQEAIAEVLESMCFLSVEEEAGYAAEDLTVAQRLSFVGSHTGNFGLRTSPHTAALIASNFLGLEPEETEDGQAAETIGEIANMACGSLLARLEGRQRFKLSPPCADENTEPASPHRVSRTLLLDEGTLHAWVEIRKAP